jgi:hypothetical protein
MKKPFAVSLCAFSLLASTGCVGSSRWTYDYREPPYETSRAEPVPVDVAVLPFEDQRGELASYGTAYLIAVPLWPVGFYDVDRPEQVGEFPFLGGYEFLPDLDLSHATAHSLKQAGIFRGVAPLRPLPPTGWASSPSSTCSASRTPSPRTSSPSTCA